MRGASLVNRTGTNRDTPLMVAVHHNRTLVVVKIVEQLSSWALGERRRRVQLSGAARSDAEKNELLSKDWVDFYRDALSLEDLRGESAIDIANRKEYTDIIEIFDNALERVRQRHAAAEKMRLAAIKVPCSLGCGHKGTQDRIKYHEERYCPRRPLPCPLKCGQEMRAELIDEHVDKKCQNRPVRCFNCYHGKSCTSFGKNYHAGVPRNVRCSRVSALLFSFNLLNNRLHGDHVLQGRRCSCTQVLQKAYCRLPFGVWESAHLGCSCEARTERVHFASGFVSYRMWQA